jgi:hypothetical protein
MQPGTYRIIPVKAKTHTVFALVSPEDYEALTPYRWFHTNGYAVRNVGSTRRGNKTSVLMHRQILGLAAGDGLEADHVNRDRLDNRRENLRQVSHARNMCNLAARDGTSHHRGVSWDKERELWKATASPNGRQRALGRFAHEDDAARAVNTFWRSLGYEAPNDVAA